MCLKLANRMVEFRRIKKDALPFDSHASCLGVGADGDDTRDRIAREIQVLETLGLVINEAHVDPGDAVVLQIQIDEIGIGGEDQRIR